MACNLEMLEQYKWEADYALSLISNREDLLDNYRALIHILRVGWAHAIMGFIDSHEISGSTDNMIRVKFYYETAWKVCAWSLLAEKDICDERTKVVRKAFIRCRGLINSEITKNG